MSRQGRRMRRADLSIFCGEIFSPVFYKRRNWRELDCCAGISRFWRRSRREHGHGDRRKEQ